MQSFTVPVASQPLAITTSRLILRQWQDKDFEPFAAMNADPQVMEFFPSVLAREKSDEMAIRCRDLITERGWGIWVVELRETGEFMGFVGLHTPGYNLPFNPCVEVGWRLRADAWGQGFLHRSCPRCAGCRVYSARAQRNCGIYSAAECPLTGSDEKAGNGVRSRRELHASGD